MTFLEECRASRQSAESADGVQLSIARDWLTARPEALFEELREHAPTFVLGRMAFVTRFADARDVLDRHDVFSVAPYGEAMVRINRGPNFLLGLDDGPEYQRQLSLLGRVFRREDADRVREIVSSSVATALDPALGEGKLELTDGFGRLVPALFAADYIGVPGPDPATLARWARTIFTDGFANVLRLPLLSRRAMKASDEFRIYLDELIVRVKADGLNGSEVGETVLGRLLALQRAGEAGVSDDWIRDNLLWCTAGMIDNINTGVCNVVDYLLGNPSLMDDAVNAARTNDTERLGRFVLEALRFRTPTPVVTRLSRAEHTLSEGTPNETRIPAGTLTFVGLGAAMMDDRVVDSPKSFRLDRPPEQYLHFGAGLHRCLGTHLALAHLTGMVGRLLLLDRLRRGKGAAGRLRHAGPFPKRFVVQFDPPTDRRVSRSEPAS